MTPGEYNKDTVKGTYIDDKDVFHSQSTVGDWAFDFDNGAAVAIFLNTPDGSPDGAFVRLPLGGDGWQWDGNLHAPTLTPSIDRHPNWNKPGWHGFMTNGEMRSV